MWIYQLPKAGHGDPSTIAEHARMQGLTHIFVRVGSGLAGLATLREAGSVLPAAHAHGIKVIAWYFPYFRDVREDVRRSLTAIRYDRHGHHFDGFAADIESAPGSRLSAATASTYSKWLRDAAPQSYLIVVPPRPTAHTLKSFPYEATMPFYDAIAPMVYWGRFDPVATTRSAVSYLQRFGKPIAPIGQAYDMGDEGGPRGVPPAHEIWAFMREAKRLKAPGVSFWSWQHATSNAWWTIRSFSWAPAAPATPPRPRVPCRLWIELSPARLGNLCARGAS